jgi:hypothetical protein
MRRARISFDHPGLFEERLSEVRNGRGQQLHLLLLWCTKNKIDEAFGHARRHLSNIDRLLPLNVFLNKVIDLLVQAAPMTVRPVRRPHACSPYLFPFSVSPRIGPSLDARRDIASTLRFSFRVITVFVST